MLEQAFGLLINEIALDIGSSNIRVYSKGRNLFVEEPAVVIAEEQKGKFKILEYGHQAQLMVGRTPSHQQAIYPLQGGIKHPKLAEKLIEKTIFQALGGKSILKPRSIVSFSQYFQKQAPHTLSSILHQTGGKDVQKINGLICAALGCALPLESPTAMMLINIGFSGTEIGVFCHSNIYRNHYIPVAGKHFNLSIQQHLRNKFQAQVSDQNIEQLKLDLCNLNKSIPDRTQVLSCKNINSGQPMELEVSSPDICSALAQPLTILLKGIISEFKLLSPRVVTDLMENGIILCGGGAQLTDLSSFLQEKLNIPVILIDKPQRVMVMGAAQLLEQEPYAHWFV
jgi:rod shape-determining protein MreB